MISAQDVSPGGGGGGGGETRGGGGGGESPSDEVASRSIMPRRAAGAVRRRTSTSTSRGYSQADEAAPASRYFLARQQQQQQRGQCAITARAGTATRRWCGKRLLALAHLDTRAVHRLGSCSIRHHVKTPHRIPCNRAWRADAADAAANFSAFSFLAVAATMRGLGES